MTYEHNKTCPGCFKAKLIGGRCGNCGYNANDRKNLLALPEHTILARKYVVGKVLGVGGFGITYLSLDLSLNKLTAIKEYLPREIAGREAGSKTVKAHTDKEDELYRYGIERFMQEAQTLARFEHDSIVRIFDNTCPQVRRHVCKDGFK